MSKEPMEFAILYGSYRPSRLGIRAVKYIEGHLQKRGHKTHVVDAFSLKLPLLALRYMDYQSATDLSAEDQAVFKILKDLAQLYQKVDGFVFISGEYNHGLQPGLKNLIDYFLDEYYFKPSAIIAYSVGKIAGMRSAMALRSVLSYLNTPSISTMLPVGEIQNTLDEQGNDASGALSKLTERFLNELEWYARALKKERVQGVPF